MMLVNYNPNNSGGSWWLDDEDWISLEKAGWKVEWASLEPVFTKEGKYEREKDGTPKLVDPCPKIPKFASRNDNLEYVQSGPDTSYSCSW